MNRAGCVMTSVIATTVFLVLALLAAGCAVRATLPSTSHPASPRAPTGRLAGPMPALRTGVVDYADVPALRVGPPPESGHHHHH